jgi:hypothetical protein
MAQSEPAYPSPTDGKLLSDLTEEVQGAIGFEVPETEVKKLYEGREQLLGEIREWGLRDTLINENVMGVIAEALVGRRSPTFGDGPEEAERFSSDMDAAAEKRGWTRVTYAS